MEIREGVKKGVRIASAIGSCFLTGATGAIVITAVPYAAPIVLCERIAVGMIAGIVSDKVADESDKFVDSMFTLKDEFQDLWNECKKEIESR